MVESFCLLVAVFQQRDKAQLVKGIEKENIFFPQYKSRSA